MQMIHCPYRVCPLGAHIDHQFGIVTGFALDHGVTLEYEPTEDGTVFVTSRNYPKTVECSLFDLPERKMYWGDFLVGAIHTLSRKYPLSVGIRGEIAGSLPTGGLSSSAAVIITYLSALCRVNGIPLTEPELIKLAIWEEQNFIGIHVGKLDQSCEVYSKKEHLLYLDTLDDSCELIPVPPNMPKFEIAVIFSGLERSLAGSAYNMRVDECRAAAYALKAFSHMEYGKYQDTTLRNVPEGIFDSYKGKLPESWYKRARHFYTEMERVKAGKKAWKQGDMEKFGRLIMESGESSIHYYQTGSDNLHYLQELMKHTKGIYGGRFSGAGFNGSSMAIVDPEYKEEIESSIRKQYIKQYPDLEGSFAIIFCQTSDGVELA